MWAWPRDGWSKLDPAAVAADLRELGVAGVIPHKGFDAAGWLHTGEAKPVDRVKPFLAEGLKVAVGIGRSGGLDDRPAAECITAIRKALDVPYGLPVMLDWEGKYDLPDGREKARRIASAILRKHPDAHTRITDCPWWAPLYRMVGRRKGYTHPRAPYIEFGALVRNDRYVQAYGKADGESQRMLSWARDPTQYTEIARKAGVAPWTIRGAFTTYLRSWIDVAETTLAEPNQVLWSYFELDDQARLGLRVARAAREAGCATLAELAALRSVARITDLPVDLAYR